MHGIREEFVMRLQERGWKEARLSGLCSEGDVYEEAEAEGGASGCDALMLARVACNAVSADTRPVC
jgi:hypothetical protein